MKRPTLSVQKVLLKTAGHGFVSENKICLACPPNKILEDIKMLNKNVTPEDMTLEMTDRINEALAQNPTANVGEIMRETIKNLANVEISNENTQSPEKLSMNYVLEQIKKISKDTEYLYDTIKKLGEMANANGPGDIVGANKAEALGNIVQSRETTNQQILRMYEKMYDDLKPISSLKEKALQASISAMDNGCFDEFSNMLDTIRHIER